MQILKENPKSHGYIYETDKFIIDYFDIFFASYNSHIIKAEKTIKSKITKEKTYWRAWFDLPKDLANDLKIDDQLSNWPPKDLGLQSRFDEWLEEQLLSENGWINDSIETYSSQQHCLPMVSFLILENINRALMYNRGLPDFLKEATKLLKKEEPKFEYLEVYSEVTKDEKGNEKKEFIVEGEEIIRLTDTSKIKLFNRLSYQGWILDFKDDDGHYIFKRNYNINIPTLLGHQQQNKEFYYDACLNLEFSQLHISNNTVEYLHQLGIFIVKDLLDTVESIDDLHTNLKEAVSNNKNIKDIEIDINRLKNIFQEGKQISLQEVIFTGYLVPIEMLELSVRGFTCLKRAQIHVIADLLKYSFEDLLEIKGMNRKTAVAIRQTLEQKLGLYLDSARK